MKHCTYDCLDKFTEQSTYAMTINKIVSFLVLAMSYAKCIFQTNLIYIVEIIDHANGSVNEK